MNAFMKKKKFINQINAYKDSSNWCWVARDPMTGYFYYKEGF